MAPPWASFSSLWLCAITLIRSGGNQPVGQWDSYCLTVYLRRHGLVAARARGLKEQFFDALLQNGFTHKDLLVVDATDGIHQIGANR